MNASSDEKQSNKMQPTETEIQRILVIGAHTILGELLIDQLEADERIKEFWLIDLHSPRRKKWKKLNFIKLDLIQPGADAKLADKLTELQIHTLIHAAQKNNPSRHPSEAHEFEVIGSINILSAIKASNVKKFIFCSTTMVYGASPKNPNYISETAPLSSHADAHFVRDKIEVERQVSYLGLEAPQVKVSVLRFSLIVGPRSKNYFTSLLKSPIVPTLLGYDPLFQFIHEDDAKEALTKAVFGDFPGIFNIVGKGVIPLSYALHEAGSWKLPVPSFFAYPLIQLLWNFQLSSVPGKLLDYFRYLWVADGQKAQDIMKFCPKYTSKEAFLNLARSKRIEEFKWVPTNQ